MHSKSTPDNTSTESNTTRRNFLSRVSLSTIPLALAFANEQPLSAKPVKPDLGPRNFDLAAKNSHQSGTATAMISMFMQGGPSQVDLMDPKPLLNKMHLQKFPEKIKYDNAAEAS
ncbi:MAG: DUF1501 domain-containing protein, partial [Planctomycetaceae bacterium]|nr:DUF1501 domain-containing protein [Planctomycetaceae bacterium]